MNVIGFDFGTTNSLITVIRNGETTIFKENGEPIPSVVSYEGSKIVVGAEAKKQLSKAGMGVHGDVVKSPKTYLGRESLIVGGVQRNPVDIVTHIVKYVCESALKTNRETLTKIDKAVVTIPINMIGQRRALLRDAFRAAGVSIIQFVHEPLAALYGFFRLRKNMESDLRAYDRQLILVFDWGGGTLDLTLCKLIDGLLVQIVNDGTEDVGGDILDNEIRKFVEQNSKPKDLNVDSFIPSANAAARLLQSCEEAKKRLSNSDQAVIYVPSFYSGLDLTDLDLEFTLTRDKLEKNITALIDKAFVRVNNILENANYTTASIAFCLATGGMSNIPIIRSRLYELFGPSRVHLSEDSSSLISVGAAWVAYDKARLHLAKNLELQLARNSYLTLLNAGTKMPIEGQISKADFKLYCVDPTDGFGKFQILCPRDKPGPNVFSGDIRRNLGNVIVPVDKKAAPFRERLELELLIDENLILKVTGRSLMVKGIGVIEIHDLEFALSLNTDKDFWLGDQSSNLIEIESIRNDPGSITIRSNIANFENKALVPGEVLYEFDPVYFDNRSFPPEEQVQERLYYKPCSHCGKPSNDPLCDCSKFL
jgi:actin-like ATPase involved in cell morphogenesis